MESTLRYLHNLLFTDPTTNEAVKLKEQMKKSLHLENWSLHLGLQKSHNPKYM